MRKNKPRLPVKMVFLILPACIAILALAAGARRFLLNSDYFKISEIIIKDAPSRIDLSHLKGRNIFSISLQDEARYISTLDAAYKRVRVVRVLPNRIFVDLAMRNPAAYVKLYKYFYIDEELMLFDAPLNPQDQELPVILGLDAKIRKPLTGRKYNLRELIVALNIIKQARQNKALTSLKIERIDVANLNNASLFIGPPAGQKAVLKDLEVKFGPDILGPKLDTLGLFLLQIKNEWDNIKYIDLRFKEPVMKFNEGKG